MNTAIGRVQFKIINGIYILKAKVVPEHRITKTKYDVAATIDTVKEEIIDVSCEDGSGGCKAAAGGCKHAVAFLFYLYHKHTMPSPTETTCLWSMPQLSKIDENVDNFNLSTYNPTGAMAITPAARTAGSGRFLQTLLQKCPTDAIVTSLKFYQSLPCSNAYTLYALLLDYKQNPTARQSYEQFDDFCKITLKKNICSKIEIDTRGQNNSQWYQLKFGRITASKVYDLSRCRTGDGSLVNSILGHQTETTEAMERGLRLEEKVVEIIKTRYNNVKRCGLFLHPDYPVFGASPDAINESIVFEIKCPNKPENKKYYIDADSSLKNKVKSQILLQMLLSGREKGVLVLVLPGFEKSRNPQQYVECFEVQKDLPFLTDVMKSSYEFWAGNIFDKLYEKFK